MRFAHLTALAMLAASSATLGAQAAPDEIVTTREDARQLTGWGFDQADTNKDGKLTWKEWERKFDTQIAADTEITPKEAARLKDDARAFFRLVDANKDKAIGRGELVGWYDKLFECQDENRDDVLTAGEVQRNDLRCSQAARLAVQAEPPTTVAVNPQPEQIPDGPSAPFRRDTVLKAAEQEFQRSDADRDGYLTLSEMTRSDEQGDPTDPATFAAFDKDRDGLISRPEFLDMALRVFDCMDRDHDGLAKLDERKKAVVQCLAAEGLTL